MTAINDMRHKILAAFEAAARECALEWVEVDDGECGGAVWMQRAGGFHTLLRLEYDFGPRCCRLSLVHNGKQVSGRCGIRYDDDATIEEVLDRFRQLLKDDAPPAGKTLNGQAPRCWSNWGH